eukprot:8446066-Prorocentrum_lima.AAC.1
MKRETPKPQHEKLSVRPRLSYSRLDMKICKQELLGHGALSRPCTAPETAKQRNAWKQLARPPPAMKERFGSSLRRPSSSSGAAAGTHRCREAPKSDGRMHEEFLK